MKSSKSRQGLGRWGRAARLWVLVPWLVLWGSAVASAQSLPERGGWRKGDFQRMVFSPELVMSNQSAIGLAPDQKQALVVEMQTAQSDLVPLQLEMAEAGEALARVLETARVDEAAAVDAAQRVMRLEAEVKTRHLILVVRIKNLLTEEQQEMLRALRDGQAR